MPLGELNRYELRCREVQTRLAARAPSGIGPAMSGGRFPEAHIGVNGATS
jgi:hypothetical protein